MTTEENIYTVVIDNRVQGEYSDITLAIRILLKGGDLFEHDLGYRPSGSILFEGVALTLAQLRSHSLGGRA